MPRGRGKPPRRQPRTGRKAIPPKAPAPKAITRRKRGTVTSGKEPEEDYDVVIAAWAKGDELVVREMRGVQVRTWSVPITESLHTSQRTGLPEQLTPGSYGPFESRMQVAVRAPRRPRAPGPVRPPAPPQPPLPGRGRRRR
jgi:hypothetical protein